MIYALVIAIAAGLLLLAIPIGLYLAGRQVLGGEKPSISRPGWSWRPNALGFSVLAIVGALLLSRVFPEILFLPLIVPFFWRFGRGGRGGGGGGGGGGHRPPGTGGPFVWQWRVKRDEPPDSGPTNGHPPHEESPIEGQYRNLDDISRN